MKLRRENIGKRLKYIEFIGKMRPHKKRGFLHTEFRALRLSLRKTLLRSEFWFARQTKPTQATVVDIFLSRVAIYGLICSGALFFAFTGSVADGFAGSLIFLGICLAGLISFVLLRELYIFVTIMTSCFSLAPRSAQTNKSRSKLVFVCISVTFILVLVKPSQLSLPMVEGVPIRIDTAFSIVKVLIILLWASYIFWMFRDFEDFYSAHEGKLAKSSGFRDVSVLIVELAVPVFVTVVVWGLYPIKTGVALEVFLVRLNEMYWASESFLYAPTRGILDTLFPVYNDTPP